MICPKSPLAQREHISDAHREEWCRAAYDAKKCDGCEYCRKIEEKGSKVKQFTQGKLW